MLEDLGVVFFNGGILNLNSKDLDMLEKNLKEVRKLKDNKIKEIEEILNEI